jgi:hypothetical protein
VPTVVEEMDSESPDLDLSNASAPSPDSEQLAVNHGAAALEPTGSPAHRPGGWGSPYAEAFDVIEWEPPEYTDVLGLPGPQAPPFPWEASQDGLPHQDAIPGAAWPAIPAAPIFGAALPAAAYDQGEATDTASRVATLTATPEYQAAWAAYREAWAAARDLEASREEDGGTVAGIRPGAPGAALHRAREEKSDSWERLVNLIEAHGLTYHDVSTHRGPLL